MIKLSITQATCRVSKTADEHITAGMIGKVVHVDLADDWSDLVKVAVCSGSGATKDVVGWTDRFVIPSEVCKNAGSVLKIGIYGYRTLDEEVIFATPTVVANLGAIEPSLSPSGDTTTEASAEVWQQILNVAESKLADAPKDGKQYLRKDGSWEELGPDEETASRIEAIEAKEASWDSKAAGDHNHAGVYQPAGSYASASHNHAGVYQPVGDYANSNHTHSYNTLTDKPTIPEAYNDTALKNRVAAIEIKESTWDGKQDAISDLDTIRAGAAAGATALQELPEHYHSDKDIAMTDFDGTLREAFAFAGGALTELQSNVEAIVQGAASEIEFVNSRIDNLGDVIDELYGRDQWKTLANFTTTEDLNLISVNFGGVTTFKELVVVLYGRWAEGMSGYLDFALRQWPTTTDKQFRLYETNRFFNNNDRICFCHAHILPDCKVIRYNGAECSKSLGRVLDSSTPPTGYGYPPDGVTSLSWYHSLVIYPLDGNNKFKTGCTVEVYYR